MTKAKALELAKLGDFSGCSFADVEDIVRLTGSKKAIAERLRRVEAMGQFVKTDRGVLRERGEHGVHFTGRR